MTRNIRNVKQDLIVLRNKTVGIDGPLLKEKFVTSLMNLISNISMQLMDAWKNGRKACIYFTYFYIFLAQHNKLFFENIYSSFFWKKINREGTFIHTPSLVMTAFPSTVTLQECFSPDFKKWNIALANCLHFPSGFICFTYISFVLSLMLIITEQILFTIKNSNKMLIDVNTLVKKFYWT